MITKYYKFFNKELDLYPKFIELDKDYYCTRQIVQKNNTLINSSIDVEGKFFLPEGSFKDYLEFLTEEITQNQFEELWQLSKIPYLQHWEDLKQSDYIGKKVNGRLICLYPQGIIFDIGQKFYAIANYDVCKAIFGTEKLYPQQILLFQITNFDNLHLWIQLIPANDIQF
ncbi:hypothetical protein ACI76O_10020 [Capnocytophaga cynodegmi]|uniref:hypothetical protein n=1 Tax=Capnocytophaga cynodegmi TaxID=28189 RepID=UPI003859433F